MKLGELRGKIDEIDRKIVGLLVLRFKIAKLISKIKKKSKSGIVDKKRELEVLSNITRSSKGKYEEFFKKVYKKIIEHSRKLQK